MSMRNVPYKPYSTSSQWNRKRVYKNMIACLPVQFQHTHFNLYSVSSIKKRIYGLSVMSKSHWWRKGHAELQIVSHGHKKSYFPEHQNTLHLFNKLYSIKKKNYFIITHEVFDQLCLALTAIGSVCKEKIEQQHKDEEARVPSALGDSHRNRLPNKSAVACFFFWCVGSNFFVWNVITSIDLIHNWICEKHKGVKNISLTRQTLTAKAKTSSASAVENAKISPPDWNKIPDSRRPTTLPRHQQAFAKPRRTVRICIK